MVQWERQRKMYHQHEVKGRSIHYSKFLLLEGLTMISYIPKKNRNVIVLSSQHQGASIEGEEHDFKPEMILDYNKIKSAVDTFVREYRCLRTSRRWPALFFDFIDIAGRNAFCAWSDHDPNYNVGKSHRRRLFLMQLAEDMVKPLIDGRARNPVGIQEPILAAIRMFVSVEHCVARHIDLRKIKVLEDVLVVKAVKVVRSVTVVTTLFAGNIQNRKQLQFVTTALRKQCDRLKKCENKRGKH